eukprot:CAMPEP_0173211268 /NCGR_PEP_ID=MMETSP1141-20130122/24132_1 /TAXON_ID=483371 /ORGANISM="non described non described, Strain CCMP2298" /LENGTH=50 /DNA_ID=CAMNT_0014138121 /DNA_START=90 /DNA_END=239 /DNA_ORIENTATION=+
MSQRIFDSEVIAQVLNPAQCERQEAESRDRVVSNKVIIPLNRANRTELVA